jgi:hypothetical protein
MFDRTDHGDGFTLQQLGNPPLLGLIDITQR